MTVVQLAKRQQHEAAESGFFAASQKIYPREVKGRFANLRRYAVIVLLGLFYGTAWVQINGQQALLFDLPARKFHIFGLTLWPQDFFYMALLMIMAALSLFFATALAGRVWCGYACPQTVWTELFIWTEQWTEGNRSHRMKLDRMPWNLEKLMRKGSKQLLWIGLSIYTGFTFVGYFTPIRELGSQIVQGTVGGWSAFWVLLYGLATYGNAGFMREQVCKYMCPYARFQSVMFDHQTLIISYDQARGEPRGARPRGKAARELGLGDCIDCTLCVQACPTGIDIRKGLQYECIACAACIDACDEVMDKIGAPRGLVRYTTEQALGGEPTRLLRPRIVIYATLLLVAASALTWSLTTRMPLIVDVLRDRNALYREVHGDHIENAYVLKIINMDSRSHRYQVQASGLEGITVAQPRDAIEIAPGTVSTVSVRLQAPSDDADGIHHIVITVAATDDAHIARHEKSRFIGPHEHPL